MHLAPATSLKSKILVPATKSKSLVAGTFFKRISLKDFVNLILNGFYSQKCMSTR
jgi:hypothetical protein